MRFISLLVACAIALLGTATSDAAHSPQRVLLGGRIVPALLIDFVNNVSKTNGVSQGNSTALLSGTTFRRSVSGLYIQPQSTLLPQLYAWGDITSWPTANASTLTGGQVAFNGNTGVLVTEGTTSAFHNVQGQNTAPSTAPQEMTFYAKASGRNFVAFGFFNNTQQTSVIVFSLSGAGSFTTPFLTSGGVQVINTAEIVNVGGGWYRCNVTVHNLIGASSSPLIGPATSATGTSADVVYTGNGTSGVIIQGPVVREDVAAFLTPSNSNGAVTFTFDNGSTQTIQGVPGTYMSMANLSRPLVTQVSIPAGSASLNGAPRAVGTGGALPRVVANGAVSSSNVRWQTRERMWVAKGGADYLQFSFVGYSLGTQANNTSSGSEVTATSAQPLELTLEFPTSSTNLNPVRVTFGGQLIGTVPTGSSEYQSDPIYPQAFGWTKFPANTKYWLKMQRDYNTGDTPMATITSSTAQVYPDESVTANKVDASYSGGLNMLDQLRSQGAIVLQANFGGTPNQIYRPAVIAGRTSTPFPAVVGAGDSIISGQGDGGGTTGEGDGGASGGWFARGLFNIDGSNTKLAWSLFSMPGAAPDSYTFSSKKTALYKYFSHGLSNHGHNAETFVPASTAAATQLGILETIWLGLKTTTGSTIYHVEQTPLLPDTSGSSSFTTTAAQTPITGFQTGQYRDLLNTSIAGTVGANSLDAVMDFNPTMAFAGGSGAVWIAPGSVQETVEGTHPNTAGTLLIAPVWAARAATYN